MLKTEMRNPKTTYLDRMTTAEMLRVIQEENFNVVKAVDGCLDAIERAVDAVTESMRKGGRLIYVGAGTSGRLGVLDASEACPTFGVPEGTIVVGISAAGGAEYVLSAVGYAKSLGCTTVGLTCNDGSPLAKLADIVIVTDTGAEVVTGSTRMKAGTAHKLVLNMLSTCSMVHLGNVYENMMVNLSPTNDKLRERMIGIVSEIHGVGRDEARSLLERADWKIRNTIISAEEG